MKPLPPIPTPPALRWREFRIRFLPAVVFAAALGTSVWIWNYHLAAPTLVGEVEVRRAHVASVQAGMVTRLNVDQFAEVRLDDPVAEVQVCDPRYLEGVIGVVKAEAEVLRLQLDPLVTQERIKVDLERLRLDLLNQKVLLATARIQLRYAESEYERMVALHAGGEDVVSQSDLDVALRDRDSWREDIASRSNLLGQIEANLAPLRASRALPDDSPLPEGWRAALELQEQRLKQALAEFGPVTLLAPIPGTVSTIYRRSGENVAAGEPIVTITATRGERIHAFLLPGSTLEPRVGMAVEVRSRSGRRASGQARVLHVAHHLDLMDSTLVLSSTRRPASSYGQASGAPTAAAGLPSLPIGRPLSISVPESLDLLPGEPVDLRFVEEREDRDPIQN